MSQMRPALPKSIIGGAWAGRIRKCPECATDFLSHYDRGRCPNCMHTFFAMDVHGPPPNVDLEQLAQDSATVSQEDSDRILKLLTEPADKLPERPEHFGNPITSSALEDHLEMWEWDNFLMQQAIAEGGDLWRWSTSPESWRMMTGTCGFAVVKDGRVVASITTAMN